MIDAILGSKQTMSQTFVDGKKVPVTRIALGPCVVTQIKTMEHDGYWAVQFGFESKKLKNTSKPLQGHLRKSQKSKVKNQNFPRYLREVRLEVEPDLKVGDEIKLTDVFSAGDIVQVTGTSKGKGFAGGIKRWGFHGGPKTHGQSDRHRAPGSIGQGTTPGRVYKGKHMAGRLGGDTKTIKNLKVISMDAQNNTALISGPIPGKTGSLLVVRKMGGTKNG